MSFFIRKILIKKSQEELGFTIGGKSPCVVSAITLSGPADLAQLRCGDEILEVNFVNVAHLSFDVVSKNILRKSAIGNVVLNVRTLYFQNVVGGSCQFQDRMICNSPGYSLKRSHIRYWNSFSSKQSPVSLEDNPIVDSENNIEKPIETSSTYLPKLFGLKSISSNNHCNQQTFKNYDFSVFTFYMCSKEITKDENIPAAGLACLKSCVAQLKKKEHLHHSFVLLGINAEGIALQNPFGKEITNYALKNIIFSAVCSDDRNFFGFVCKTVFTSSDGNENSPSARYDCHVFMIDKNISKHEQHKQLATLLDLPCLKNDGCQLFPTSCSLILKELNAVYERRKNDSGKEGIKRCQQVITSSPACQVKRDIRRLMVSPPSSLVGLGVQEKEELLKGLASGCESPLRSQFTRSLTRKPPPAPIKTPSEGSLSRKNGGFTLLNSLQSRRRKSEGLFKPPASLSSNKRDTPVRSSFFGSKCDTNENVKRLSLASSASESSLNRTNNVVESWSSSFENLLAEPIGLRCFQEFLKKEFSEENILFWVACENFKKIFGFDKMKEQADKIFQQYLASNAPSLVNVNQNGLKNVEENLIAPHSEMFTAPQDQVFQLMKFDSYNRFLKSDLYRECLEAEQSEKHLPFEDEASFGRKSKSPLHDLSGDWKKQIMSFLSKGGKRTEIKGLGKESSFIDDNGEKTPGGFVRHHSLKDSQLWDGLHSQSKGNFLRIILPDGTSTIIVAETGLTLKESLTDICKTKNISLSAYDVTVGFPRKIAPLDQEISTLNDNVVFLEKRILFRFDLPNSRSVGIKANPNKTLLDVLQPVMKRNSFNIHEYTVHILNSKHIIPLDSSVSVAENKRLSTRKTHKKLEKQMSDSLTLKSSSDLRSSLRRLRAGSFNKEEKGKQEARKDEKDNDLPRTFSDEVKHILLGRTKSNDDGASALMSVLQRSQSSRMDDQRGLLSTDLELPDFLKSPATENIALPSPRSSVNSMNCSPSKSLPCPPSPLIIDKMLTQYTYDPMRSPSLSRSLNGGLFSVTSWKEIASPDRELVDKSYTNTLSSDEYDTRSKPSLLELSRSDPTLCKETLKKLAISKENSLPLPHKQQTNSNESSKEKLNCSFEVEILGVEDTSSHVNNQSMKNPSKHKTRLGSIDLINYDLSPRETSVRRLLDPFQEIEDEPVFLHNAIPTPEKPKLLQGETVLGRQNEKITYV